MDMKLSQAIKIRLVSRLSYGWSYGWSYGYKLMDQLLTDQLITDWLRWPSIIKLIFNLKGLTQVVLLLLPALAHGAFEGAVSMATGGSGASVLEDSEAGALNPAFIGAILGYRIRLTGASGSEDGIDFSSNEKRETYLGRKSYLVSITDNTPETLFASGLHYQKIEDAKGVFEYQNGLLNFGYVADEQNKKLFWGWGFGYLVATDKRQLESVHSGYLQLGTVYFVTSDFSIGFVTDELRGVKNSFQKTEIGTSYILSHLLRLRAGVSQGLFNDSQGADNLAEFYAGAEAYLNRWFVLRWGGRLKGDQSSGQVGFGFVGPRLNLNYAYVPEMGHPDQLSHWVDLSLPVW